MSCKELIEFLGAYEAGELPAGRRARFEEHLARCPDCRDYLATYRETIRLSRASGEPAPEPDLDAMPEELVQAILSARR